MTKRIEDQDLNFIAEHRQDVFKGRNHYWGILRGKVNVPDFPVEIPEDLSLSDLNVLSFGQFVANKAQSIGIAMIDVAQALQITVDELTEIYDDVILPWDLSEAFILKTAQTLNISITALIRAIQNHMPSNETLRNRLPQQSIAARSHHTLDQATRKNDLIEAQIAMQKHKELQKRDAFIMALKSRVNE